MQFYQDNNSAGSELQKLSHSGSAAAVAGGVGEAVEMLDTKISAKYYYRFI